MWESSNPALNNNDAFSQFYSKDMFATRANVTTLAGVVNKTAILVGIAIAAGALSYGWFAASGSFQMLLVASIVSLIVCFGIGYKLCGNPALAKVLGPIYAVVEGVFLGGLTALADAMLASRGLSVAGGVGVQAFIITACAMASMLALYRARLIRPTRTLQAVLSVATLGIMAAYLISFILSFFWQPLPLISFASAVSDSGPIGFLGLGINIFILIIASLWLIIDFGTIEQKISEGAPKHMEWYCGFALLVTLAWIYYESVKLVVRLAVLFNNRD